MTTPNAIEAIRVTKQAIGERGLIGVGTVLDAGTCQSAIEAGAEFVVSPILRRELVRLRTPPAVPSCWGPTLHRGPTGPRGGRGLHQDLPGGWLGPGLPQGNPRAVATSARVPDGRRGLEHGGRFPQGGVCRVGVGSSLVSARILREADWRELTDWLRRLWRSRGANDSADPQGKGSVEPRRAQATQREEVTGPSRRASGQDQRDEQEVSTEQANPILFIRSSCLEVLDQFSAMPRRT